MKINSGVATISNEKYQMWLDLPRDDREMVNKLLDTFEKLSVCHNSDHPYFDDNSDMMEVLFYGTGLNIL